MLAKKPDERLASMAEVRAALAAAGRLPNALSPEHKIGGTDPFGGTAAMPAQKEKPTTVPPTTLTPGGMVASEVPGITVKTRRGSRLAILIGAAVVAVAVVAALALRKPTPPPAVPRPTTTVEPAPPPVKAPPATVRVHLDSTPAGARIVRVADGAVLGTTPETIEQRSTATPLLLRFEKEGFVPATREVALASDGDLNVVLEAVAAAPPPAAGSPRRRGGRPQSAPAGDEPAKL